MHRAVGLVVHRIQPGGELVPTVASVDHLARPSDEHLGDLVPPGLAARPVARPAAGVQLVVSGTAPKPIVAPERVEPVVPEPTGQQVRHQGRP